MKATGIVRRIDDLGRVVIPKEIRRTMQIRDGDPLEIYTEKDGEVIFKKYSPVGELGEFAGRLCETMGKAAGRCAAIADREALVAVYGIPKRELMEKRLSSELEQLMERRQMYRRLPGEKGVPVADGPDGYSADVAAPVVAEGDVLGCVLFLGKGESAPGEVEYKLAQTVSGFLGKQLSS